MRYGDDDPESRNVEDRRGRGGGFRMPGGFGFPGGRSRGRQIRIPMGGGRGGGFSITTLLIIGAIMMFFGINPLKLIGLGGGPGAGLPDFSQVPQMPRMERTQPRSSNNPFQIPTPRDRSASTQTRANDALGTFTKRVLADTEEVWNKVFRQFGKDYREPTLVLYSGSTHSACGRGQAAMGPFYCPLDEKIYIDLSFYHELKRKFRAPGDFAQAYVIAHEVGHHIQKQLGIADRVLQLKQRLPKIQANKVQVRMELQADCIAGVWAHPE